MTHVFDGYFFINISLLLLFTIKDIENTCTKEIDNSCPKIIEPERIYITSRNDSYFWAEIIIKKKTWFLDIAKFGWQKTMPMSYKGYPIEKSAHIFIFETKNFHFLCLIVLNNRFDSYLSQLKIKTVIRIRKNYKRLNMKKIFLLLLCWLIN